MQLGAYFFQFLWHIVIKITVSCQKQRLTAVSYDMVINKEMEEVEEKSKSLEYGVEDYPPWCISVFLAIQVIMAILSGPVGIAFVIFSLICADGEDLVLSKLINTSIFTNGIATFLQVTFGVRLPVIQGSSYIYLIPILTMLQSEQWKCPEKYNANYTNEDIYNNSVVYNSLENLEQPWRPRLAAISGSLAMASILHLMLGATGITGVLMRWVGPLTLTPTIGMIGLMLFDAINVNSHYHWGIAFGTVALIVIFSLLLKDVTVPWPSCGKGKKKTKTPVFKLFSTFLAMMVMWILCIILTVAGAFPSDPDSLAYKTRADARLDVMTKSAWVYFPYPGQWGPISFDYVTVLSTVGCVIGSVIESIADYHATARVCHVAAPPRHAINRGIMIEGICSIISSLFGAAHATTSYSNIMGFISYTGNASRISFQVASAILILLGIFGKFGAAMAIIPQPVLGGAMLVGTGMCFSIAISNVKSVDLESPRNQMVLAISFVLGVSMPMCYKDYPRSLQTDVFAVDQIIKVLCTNAPLLAGLVGCLLDNLIPGTRKERGMADLKVSPEDVETQGVHNQSYEVYHTRIYTYLSKFKITRYLPFLPDEIDMEREIKSSVRNRNSQLLTKE